MAVKKSPGILLLLLIVMGTVVAAETPAPTELDLAKAIQMALAADPQVLSAEAGVASAKARVAQEAAKIAPGCTVSVAYGQTPYIDLGMVEKTNITVTISQNRPGLLPRIIGGRVASAIEQALWDQADAEARLSQARIAATAAAMQKYLAAAKAGELVTLSQGALDLAKEDERVARASLEGGIVTKLDVLKAESNREKAALELQVAMANRRLSLDALLVQIGRPLGGELSLSPVPPITETPVDAQEKLQAQIEKLRPEIMTARTAVRKAEAVLTESRNASLPAITLSATEQQGNNSITIALDLTSGDVQWDLGGNYGEKENSSEDPSINRPKPDDGLSLGLNLTWTPFDGGYRRATTAAAEAALRSAEVARDRVLNELRLELGQRLSDLNAATLRLAQAKRERELAAETRELAALRYREGIGLFSDLGQATQALSQGEFGVVQAGYDLLEARVALDVTCVRMPGIGIKPKYVKQHHSPQRRRGRRGKISQVL